MKTNRFESAIFACECAQRDLNLYSHYIYTADCNWL